MKPALVIAACVALVALIALRELMERRKLAVRDALWRTRISRKVDDAHVRWFFEDLLNHSEVHELGVFIPEQNPRIVAEVITRHPAFFSPTRAA
jgi:hypothetical protein